MYIVKSSLFCSQSIFIIIAIVAFLEPFRVGTDRLPVYMMSWNRSVQKVNIVVENIVAENCPFQIALSRISPCLISKRT